MLTIILLLFHVFSFAQHQTDKWYFGTHAGIDFSSIPAPMTNGALNNQMGAASMSDSAGNLLFYTDGQRVWNRYHQTMANGSGLLGGMASQAAVIVPKPGSSTEYYIFTNDVNNGPNGLQFSMVDMSLDTGRGSVTALNFFVQDQITEKLAVTSNRTGDGYWVTVHEYGGDMFYNYRLTNAGLDPTIVVCNTGLSHNSSTPQNGIGQMKYSPCGDRLAVAIGALDTVEIFDFDNSTGIISNPIDIAFPNPVFGVEFSKNGRLLYVTTTGQNALYQFDLNAGNETDIQNSGTSINLSAANLAIQMGPDGKIYVSKESSSWMGAINNPDSLGIACDFVDSIFNISPGTAGKCLPSFVASLFRDTAICQPITLGISEASENNNLIYPNPSSSEFRIDLNEKSIVKVYDIHGRIIDEFKEQNSFSFGKYYSAGIYLINICGEKNTHTTKLIKN